VGETVEIKSEKMPKSGYDLRAKQIRLKTNLNIKERDFLERI
jgi:hypothetical protein